MGALTDGTLQFRVVEQTPEEITASRKRAEQILGRPLPPTPHEVQAYLGAGLQPPTV